MFGLTGVFENAVVACVYSVEINSQVPKLIKDAPWPFQYELCKKSILELNVAKHVSDRNYLHKITLRNQVRYVILFWIYRVGQM